MIYTIGYQALKPERLRAIVQDLGARLVDCRSSTRSRIPGFGGRQLATMLGDAYVDAGEWLGGRRASADPEAIAYLRETFYTSDTEHCVLMCMEELPSQCHRHQMICWPNFPDARHIMFGKLLVSARGVENFIATGEAPECVGELAA